jgi:hypothetical protein
MKAIVMATAATAVVAVIVTIGFRRAGTARGAGVMLKVFAGCAPALVTGWFVTPDDLGFLPRTLVAEPAWLDLVGCLFFYTASFGGGLLQLYNLADRGLSLRILAELQAAAGHAMTADDIAARYSDGRGLAWMYDKRLDGLVGHRLVVVEGGEVVLTGRGRLVASCFAWMRRFLRLPQP